MSVIPLKIEKAVSIPPMHEKCCGCGGIEMRPVNRDNTLITPHISNLVPCYWTTLFWFFFS